MVRPWELETSPAQTYESHEPPPSPISWPLSTGTLSGTGTQDCPIDLSLDDMSVLLPEESAFEESAGKPPMLGACASSVPCKPQVRPLLESRSFGDREPKMPRPKLLTSDLKTRAPPRSERTTRSTTHKRRYDDNEPSAVADVGRRRLRKKKQSRVELDDISTLPVDGSFPLHVKDSHHLPYEDHAAEDMDVKNYRMDEQQVRGDHRVGRNRDILKDNIQSGPLKEVMSANSTLDTIGLGKVLIDSNVSVVTDHDIAAAQNTPPLIVKEEIPQISPTKQHIASNIGAVYTPVRNPSTPSRVPNKAFG